MPARLTVKPKLIPELDPGFVPAVLWNRAYRECVQASGTPLALKLALVRPDGSVSVQSGTVLEHTPENTALNLRYMERLLKFLLWQKGGYKILVSGSATLAEQLNDIYSATGARAFDHEFIGERVYGRDLTVTYCAESYMPEEQEATRPLGRHLGGNRIGFDLGGSDRKCAAVINGQVVHSEEVAWNPYFESDPSYHIEGIQDSLERAAAHLPHVDAIGGSAAGVYVDNEPRVGSLFRGVSVEDFNGKIRGMFRDLKHRWGDVPFEVVNDGEVTALAGAMSLQDDAVLGISMGTSLAAGYVTPEGTITPWLNELAFTPVDYRETGPVDEWSGDQGCGVQFFSQQGIARLAPVAGLEFPADMPFADQLSAVQERMAQGDDRARKIYETIGTCFGYTIAHYAEFYAIRNLLVLGRVTSGEGGQRLIDTAKKVLETEFPSLADTIQLCTPSEKDKRHGQAVAAASLPAERTIQ